MTKLADVPHGELAYTPPYELWKTEHGTDGWDAKSWPVAKFTAFPKAVAYLKARGFTYKEATDSRVYAHEDPARRNSMGQVTYEIRDVRPTLPVDPE